MSDYYGFENRDEYIKWLKSLKEGDEVCYARSWRSVDLPYKIIKVERITKTGWIKTDNNMTFVDGHERGKTYGWEGRKTIQPVTNNIHLAIHEHQLRNYFSSFTFKDFTYEELVKISNFMTELKAGKE